ncbi:hypothetical protein FOMPIDRAFT_1028091 [Fomitopsis schrenkii]|uniref:Endonuclease/exonuclease/phosphatase domain-containing protein n=1 Tax=Fomitopsis schrenkii TaxID=2126942 RepID=S8FSY5_FOMSC|nr:hypothetical protein FOMPIDRAFT_1028091 [Fomitopsis schrenkii]
MKEQRIGLLAIQEAHLNKETVNQIHKMYGRRLRVLYSKDPDTDNARGVAFVINRELTNLNGLKVVELIPGRAMHVELDWHGTQKLTAINVYAPNAASENTTFWEHLRTAALDKGVAHPMMLLGDFNNVEEAIDRVPTKEDPEQVVSSLQNTIREWSLQDGWRTGEPTAKGYTFPQRGSTSGSRLDRIYASKDIMKASDAWDIVTTSIPTDHKLVLAYISTRQCPFIGKGRWVIPTKLLTDIEYIHAIEAARRTALIEMENSKGNRTEEHNPQTIYQALKRNIRSIAQRRLKKLIPKLRITTARLKTEITEIQQKAAFTTSEELQHEAAILQERLQRKVCGE